MSKMIEQERVCWFAIPEKDTWLAVYPPSVMPAMGYAGLRL